MVSLVCNCCVRHFIGNQDGAKDIAQNAKFQVGDTASKAADSVKNAASGIHFLIIH